VRPAALQVDPPTGRDQPSKPTRFAREVTQARLRERLAPARHCQLEVWVLSDVEGVIDPNELALIPHTQLAQHSVDYPFGRRDPAACNW
jgi:hypothetical protein